MIEERKLSSGTFPVVEESQWSGCYPGHVVKPRYAGRVSSVADALDAVRSQVHDLAQRELGKDPIARADKFFTEHLGIHKRWSWTRRTGCAG